MLALSRRKVAMNGFVNHGFLDLSGQISVLFCQVLVGGIGREKNLQEVFCLTFSRCVLHTGGVLNRISDRGSLFFGGRYLRSRWL